MDWKKAILAGVVAGIVMSIAEYVLHGVVMASTYARYPDVFTQEQSNPIFFMLTALCISIFAAILFGKTRQSWADGFKGGATYGFFLGMTFFFVRFYDALVYDGYPYYLSWCQGSIALIVIVIAGGVMGLMYRREG